MNDNVIQFVPRPNPNRFTEAYGEVRKQLADLVTFAKQGEPPASADTSPSEMPPPESA